MKTLYRIALVAIFTMGLTACDDFLDSEPKSSVDPDKYFTEASHVASLCGRDISTYSSRQ